MDFFCRSRNDVLGGFDEPTQTQAGWVKGTALESPILGLSAANAKVVLGSGAGNETRSQVKSAGDSIGGAGVF